VIVFEFKLSGQEINTEITSQHTEVVKLEQFGFQRQIGTHHYFSSKPFSYNCYSKLSHLTRIIFENEFLQKYTEKEQEKILSCFILLQSSKVLTDAEPNQFPPFHGSCSVFYNK